VRGAAEEAVAAASPRALEGVSPEPKAGFRDAAGGCGGAGRLPGLTIAAISWSADAAFLKRDESLSGSIKTRLGLLDLGDYERRRKSSQLQAESRRDSSITGAAGLAAVGGVAGLGTGGFPVVCGEVCGAAVWAWATICGSAAPPEQPTRQHE